MISSIDKGDNWAMVDYDNEEIVWDKTMEREPITCSHFRFDHGKYKGYKVSEVDDTWYLDFIMKKNPDNALITLILGKRLGELKL